MEKIPILGVPVNLTDYQAATKNIDQWAKGYQSRYLCAANVQMVMEGYDHATFQDILRKSDLVTPDGMPLVWMMRLKGVKGQPRVYGPTLMMHVLEMAAREQIPVGFYGGEASTLDRLVKRISKCFPNLRVAYAFSPPYRTLEDQEFVKINKEITQSGSRILFVGLGCPKQEIWMAEHKGKIAAVMLGVGAAFDFHAGTKPQAPGWMQAIGMEWFFRLLHEPRRLAKRYFYNNPRFIILAVADLLGLLKTAKKEG